MRKLLLLLMILPMIIFGQGISGNVLVDELPDCIYDYGNLGYSELCPGIETDSGKVSVKDLCKLNLTFSRVITNKRVFDAGNAMVFVVQFTIIIITQEGRKEISIGDDNASIFSQLSEDAIKEIQLLQQGDSVIIKDIMCRIHGWDFLPVRLDSDYDFELSDTFNFEIL